MDTLDIFTGSIPVSRSFLAMVPLELRREQETFGRYRLRLPPNSLEHFIECLNDRWFPATDSTCGLRRFW